MKASQKIRSSILFLLLILLLVVSGCNKEQAAQTSVQNENLNYKFASNEYVEIIEKLMEYWADQDFDAYGTLLAEDVISFAPYNPHEAGNETWGREREMNIYKNWTKNNEVENIEFSDISIVAIETEGNKPFYKESGINVMAFATMKMTIYGKPINHGISWIFHFNNEKLIDKIYLFFDAQQQFNAMN
ncbi:MAG: nuclear transport factor 2 family protein [Flavobacteriaceae bacterium]|nr:nuclear transport factor 2 family protein [Flavobacteriaceae bacterium]